MSSQTEKIINNKAKHQYFIGVDSDGCAFDTMEIKHKQVFIPLAIDKWRLGGLADRFTEVAEFINLYSSLRGTNRFPALAMTFRYLEEWMKDEGESCALPDVGVLERFVEDTDQLSNEALKAFNEKEKDDFLGEVIEWSEAGDHLLKELTVGNEPYNHVKTALKKASKCADTMIVSAAATGALHHEWGQCGLLEYMTMVAGQEIGPKADQLRYAVSGKYDSDKVLLMGDAPGDYAAAKANNALFFPIFPGREAESWQRFEEEALDRFLDGTYKGAYEKSLVDEFMGLLPTDKPWCKNIPTFIHGNTYYSHANPTEELEENFKKMSEMGLNAVRVAEIWPGWSVLEPKEGKYSFDVLDDYVRMAGEQGLKVCMGVGINDTPSWLFNKYPELRSVDFNGRRATRRVHSACIDHKQYRQHMEKFIKEITARYADNDHVFSFQLGNEIRYQVAYCDCNATRERFREWLRDQYKCIDDLNSEWATQYENWDQIYPYKSYDGPPTEGNPTHCLKSQAYQSWALEELIQWGREQMRPLTDKPIFHNNNGTPNLFYSHWNVSASCDVVVIDIYAVTYDNPGFYNGFMLDTAASIARQQGKPLWIGETTAGQYGTYNRLMVKRDLIENCVMEDIGAGVKGLFYFRHKAPKYEQPHKFTGSQTFFRRDGSEMVYAETPKRVRGFMHHHQNRLMASEAVQPKIAVYYPAISIRFSQEADFFRIAQRSAFGSRALWAGMGMPVEILDEQALSAADLSGYDLIYLPVSYLLPSYVGEKLKNYVGQGGVLVSEGRPGYVDEHGHLYEHQPGAGLHDVFGASEDLFYNTESFKGRLKLTGADRHIEFKQLKQTFRCSDGTPFIWDGEEVVGVANQYGKGWAYILGGAPSLYFDIGTGKYDFGKVTTESSDIQEHRQEMVQLLSMLVEVHGLERPVAYEGGHPEMTVRYLENGNEILMFAVNYSKSETVALTFKNNKQVKEELTCHGTVPAQCRTEVKPMSWKCWLIDRR